MPKTLLIQKYDCQEAQHMKMDAFFFLIHGQMQHTHTLLEKNNFKSREKQNIDVHTKQRATRTSLLAQTVKRLPAMWETQGSIPGSELCQRRKQQHTPVLLPGKSHGGKNLVGYRPWGCKELDKSEQLHFHFHSHPKIMKLTAVFQVTLPFKNNRIHFLEHWVKIIITLDLLTLSRNELFS